MELTSWVFFVFTFLSVLILPGPNSAFVVGQSIRYGVSSSLVVPLGFMTATGIHAVIVFSGLGLIIQTYSAVLLLLKWLGVLYLLYLAYKAFTSSSSLIAIFPREISKFKMYLSAIFVSLTNPKALLANLMIFPLFINQEQSLTPQAIVLSLTAMAISFIIYSSYCLAASALKNKLTSSVLAKKLTGSLYLGAAGILASKQT